MTTIKRFTPDYKMHAVRFEAFAREAEHGELVRFDAHQQLVSTLEAERDALAAENAVMRAAIDDIADTLETGTDGMLFTAVDNAVNLKATQTDSALAAIRKESHIAGIQAAADRIGVISLKYKPGQKQELIKSIGREVFRYANELREAK
ncbi:hypothetical protein [Serratia marcescens]|uniref:hypothetical protein n=1 Tax=Serratia marcescens TaxID=615 RepID=UPI00197F502B|nr:hypothetical protein [Serratia marcescens]MBN3978271.1 hypothetical protein [Serratia marcescens]